MNLGTVEMTPRCGKCGSDNLTVPDETEESVVTCESCGAENGTWGDLRSAAENHAGQKLEEHFQSTFEEAFEGIDGVEFKKSS